MFWNNVELEVDTMKLKQAEVQFAVDQSLTGNKANSILNEMKLSFILNQKKNAPVIGYKRTYSNGESTQLTPPNKEKNHHSGSIPPDGTALPDPPLPLNFVPPNEETPDTYLDSVPTNTQHWSLPSGKFVEEIYEEGIRMNDHEKLLSKRIKKNKNVANLPDDQTHSKKPLMESHQNHNSTSNHFTKFNCEEDVDIESEYYDARKRHKIFIRDTSKEDWIVESYNLSNEFRNFHQLTIRQVKETPYLCYKQDIQKILCLSNIMLIERTKPSYLTVTSTIWN